MLHVVLGIGGISLGRVRLGQGPDLRQSSHNLAQVPNVFYVGEWYCGVGPLIDGGVHKFLSGLAPLKLLLVR